jgi:hypothetical protein
VNQANVNAQELKSILIPRFGRALQEKLTEASEQSWSLYASANSKYATAEQLLLCEIGLQDWIPAHRLNWVRGYREAVGARRIDAEHFQPQYAELRERIRRYPLGFSGITDAAHSSEEKVDPHVKPEEPFQYVELGNINEVIGVIEDADTICGKDAPSRARMLLRSGDVIASSVAGSLDKVALVTAGSHGAVGSTGFFVLRPRSVKSEYLLALTKSVAVRDQLRCEASGTILAAVPASSLRHIIIPNVPREKRDQIAALVRESHDSRRNATVLFGQAERAVEMAIEEGEEVALGFLSNVTKTQ